MRVKLSDLVRVCILFIGTAWVSGSSWAGELTVELGKADGVTLVGAIRRWDADGNARAAVDAKARIDSPRVDARAEPAANGRWIFRDLADGRYDLVILADPRVRVEGFCYPPIAEFDPFLPSTAPSPGDETRDWIVKEIARARHYENKVSPLFFAGDDKQVRVLVQLVRDQPTSLDGDLGVPSASVRHEVWQFANNYGGWVKDRRSKVLDRILMARDELRRWTWVWKPQLGGIQVGQRRVNVSYEWPAKFDPRTDLGWYPN